MTGTKQKCLDLVNDILKFVYALDDYVDILKLKDAQKMVDDNT